MRVSGSILVQHIDATPARFVILDESTGAEVEFSWETGCRINEALDYLLEEGRP